MAVGGCSGGPSPPDGYAVMQGASSVQALAHTIDIALSTQPNVCSEAAGNVVPNRSEQWLISLSSDAEGTMSVMFPNRVVITDYDASCNATSYEPISGTITLTWVDGNRVQGSADVMISSSSGQVEKKVWFDAPACGSVDNYFFASICE